VTGVSGDAADLLRRNPEGTATCSLPIKECTMRLRLTFVAPLLVAGAAVVAVTAAPVAAAAPAQTPVNSPAQQSCSTSGPGSVCQSPGDVQINDAPPPVSFYPYGGEAFLL
jgi:hypothetical protein